MLTLLPALLGYRQKAHYRVADDHHAPAPPGVTGRPGWFPHRHKVPTHGPAFVIAGLTLLALPARDLTLARSRTMAPPAPTSTQRKGAYDLVAEKFGPAPDAPSSSPRASSSLWTGRRREAGSSLPTAIVSTASYPNRAPTPASSSRHTGYRGGHRTDQATLERVRALAPAIKAGTAPTWRSLGRPPPRSTSRSGCMTPLLLFGLVVVGISPILLTLVFRSLLVPITAALGYRPCPSAPPSVSSPAVFRWAAASSPDGPERTRTGHLVHADHRRGVLFGLAMDYQVFLVSSMRARCPSRATPSARSTPASS